MSPCNGNPRGSGVWKFNCDLLADSDFVAKMHDLILSHHSLIPSFASLGAWWGDLKVSIRRACVDFSVQKRKRLNRDHDLLTKQLIRAKQLVFSGDSRFVDTVNDLESKLTFLINKSCEEGEEGEKPTRFFFRLEQKRAEKNSFSSLFDTDGTERFSQAHIELILVNFYKSLFSKDALDMRIQEELIRDLDTCLTDYERDLCEGLFTTEELFTALSGLQAGKSPGSDGLPPEFYSAFWDDLSDSLLSVLNECYNTGSLN